MLYETHEEYIHEFLDGYADQGSKEKAIAEAGGIASELVITPGDTLYPKVKSRTVFDWFKESGDDGFVGQKIVYLRPARVP